jgi:DNA polymerase-3 subunit delta'
VTEPGLGDTVFRDVVGQDGACDVLASALRSKRVPHAYLFVGPEGVGKRTVALRWAQALHCSAPPAPAAACGACSDCRKVLGFTHPDVLWVDFEFQSRLLEEPPEKQRALKIDTVREMGHLLRLKPLESRVKTAFLEPADQLVEVAAHALLKILEEPPPSTHIVLLAQDPSQLLGTLRSRCQWVRFRPLPTSVLVGQLQSRVAGLSDDDARAAALQSEGSLRRALAALEQGEELSFDWRAAPLSELMAWCEQFQGSRLGRPAAEVFLQRQLARLQADLHAGRGDASELRNVLSALQQVRQNVSPQLVLETLLLRARWDGRRPANRGN